MKKLVVIILIPSMMIFLNSCYSQRSISRDEFQKEYGKESLSLEEEEYNGGNLVVFTKNMEKYQLNRGEYYVKSDSLFGKGTKFTNDNLEIPFSGALSLNDIESYDIEQINPHKTLLLSLGIIGGVVLLFFIVIHSSGIGGFTGFTYTY